MNNIEYFEYSNNNLDDIFDYQNPKGFIVIPENKDELNALTKANNEIKDIIITYSQLKEIGCVDEELTNRLFKKLINLIENTKNINYSQFCVYFNVLGCSYSYFMDNRFKFSTLEKIELLKTLTDYYLENRHYIYSSYGYSNEVLQVMSDAASSRRKGKNGINKILDIIKPLNFEKVKTIKDFELKKFAYVLPENDVNLFNKILIKYKINFRFKKDRQNKNPDILLKIDKKIFIIEHKLTNGAGGSQNAEINEIIDFIKQSEENVNVHYVSCLQGSFFKNLNGKSTQPKNVHQLNSILENLKLYKNNYFVNGQGLKKLIEEVVSL